MNKNSIGKKTATLALIAALTLSLGGTALAYRGMDENYGSGNCYMYEGNDHYTGKALTPEKQQIFDQIMLESRAKMTPLMDKMWAKQTELRALSDNPNTKPESISKLVAEMSELRTQMRNEMIARNDKIKSSVGINPGYGMHNGRGHGGGKGHGGKGRGHDGYGMNGMHN